MTTVELVQQFNEDVVDARGAVKWITSIAPSLTVEGWSILTQKLNAIADRQESLAIASRKLNKPEWTEDADWAGYWRAASDWVEAASSRHIDNAESGAYD